MTEHRTLDDLVALRPRMKALAVPLLGDERTAEDAYLIAMRNPPRIEHNVEGWFRTVTRRAACGSTACCTGWRGRRGRRRS